MKKIIVLVLMALVSLSLGCDIGNSSDSVNFKTRVNDDYVQITEIPNSPEYQIRESFIRETQQHIKFVKNIEKLRSSILNFEHQNAGKYLQYKIPEKYDAEKYSDVHILMKAFAGMIATDYCVTKKIIFDSEMLSILDKSNDYAFKWNVFESADLPETARKIAFWHFRNYKVSDGVFYSTHNDFSPFTEDEISLLIWSKILQDWTGNKYKNEITKEMIDMGILEFEEGKLYRTSEWYEKIKKDTEDLKYNMTRSKIKYKYNLGFSPENITDSISSKLNNEYPEQGFNSSLGLGGNLGGGGGPGGGTGCADGINHQKHTMIRSSLITEYETEELLSLFEIQSLLASKEFKKKFQGIIHLFRFIDENNDYSKIADVLPAFETEENQLNNYIYKKIERLAQKASNTKDRNYIKDFLYSLFANQTKNRSKYLNLILKSSEDNFTSRFVELLLNYKIVDAANQEVLIDFIVTKKWDKYIPQLFDWRFNKDNTSKDNMSFISVGDFCASFYIYNRDITLTNIIRILKKLSSEEYFDINELSRKFFTYVTYTSYKSDNRGEYVIRGKSSFRSKVDSKYLEKNQKYLKEVHLFKDYTLRQQLYIAVAMNCDVEMDETIYKWLENENDVDLLRSLSFSFIKNIFRIKSKYIYYKVEFDINDDDKTPEIVRNAIRKDEIRFEKFARIAISRKIQDLDYYVFHFLIYMKASRAWSLIKQVLDNNIEDWYFRTFSKILDDMKHDELGLIEVEKLRSLQAKYLIDRLTTRSDQKLYFFITALGILVK